MSALTVAQVLDRAADLIEPEGAWTQGAFCRDENGIAELDEDHLATDNPVCWCALGALAEVSGFDPLKLYPISTSAPLIPAYPFLREMVGGDVADWNDAPERTQSEVVAKLREAANLARERGL